MSSTPLRLIVFVWLFAVAASAGAAGPWRASERNTSGWEWMTPKERLEHQATVRAFTSYEACHAYQLQHHADMEARAQAAGQMLKPESQRRDFCEHLRTPKIER